MRPTTLREVEEARVKDGPLKSSSLDGNNGLFVFEIGGVLIQAIAHDGEYWERVSVCPVLEARFPIWKEMNQIKEYFWEDSEVVIQLYIKDRPANNKYTLHLYKSKLALASHFPPHIDEQ